MKKIYKYIHSVLTIIKYKIFYRKKLKISFFNSLEGKISIDIKNNSKMTIGKKLMIRGPVYFHSLNNSKINIGDSVFFNHNCSITSIESISIGNNCMFGNNVVLVDHNHINTLNKKNEYTASPIIIEDNVWIGANVTILKGVTIGKGAIVAANSLVNKSIPPLEIWGGVPVKKLSKK